MNEDSWYVLEERDVIVACKGHTEYRFVSLFNGMRGPWRYEASVARYDGMHHETIVKTVYKCFFDIIHNDLLSRGGS